MDRTHMTTVATTSAPSPSGAYSQAIVANGFVYVSGQGPIDPATGAHIGSDIAAQTTATLANLGAVLEAAGSSLARVVKTTVHLADLVDFLEFDAAYNQVFDVKPPARTTVQSGLPGILVEIDVIALTGD